jgi:hypothetical protein
MHDDMRSLLRSIREYTTLVSAFDQHQVRSFTLHTSSDGSEADPVSDDVKQRDA